MEKLFCDCKTDAEKSAFFLSGRAVETGVIAAAISNDVAMAYHRCDEFKKEVAALQAKSDTRKALINLLHAEIDALRAKIEQMEKRLRLIREEPENTMSNSKALREMVRQARLALEESK